jgi:hypothetical protein
MPTTGGLQGPLVEQIESMLDGKREALDFNFTVLVTAIDHHCVVCGAPVEPILLASGREYHAEVFTDDQRETRVDLTRPHICSKLLRHDESCDSDEPEEPEWP